MQRKLTLAFTSAAALLLLLPLAAALPHDERGHGDMDMDTDMGDAMGSAPAPSATASPVAGGSANVMSYFIYDKHSGAVVAHAALMILGWFFVLPIGVMFSIARSRFALPTQFLFLLINAFGVLVGIIYNSQTPDLYRNNAHHKIGWIATWVMSAQVVMSLAFVWAGRNKASAGPEYERAAFLPVTTEAMDEYAGSYPSHVGHQYRWSGDSGQGTERNSSSLHCPSEPTSPVDMSHDDDGFEKPEVDFGAPVSNGRGCFDCFGSKKFLDRRLPGLLSSRVLKGMGIVYEIIDRTILILGFVAITTGAVTYGGIFRGSGIFNGLAHFVKGGIFLWYGLLTLGRWAGCFADLGWAWNVKPTRDIVGKWKTRIPSGEFTESFVIFLYGASNVFLEHLAAWGDAWSAQDLEHVSISIMFFGGGLCGMLIDSKRVREWLNSTVVRPGRNFDAHNAQGAMEWQVPQTQRFPMNPVPGLVILLLGMMMSSHHQDSMTSTMVHKQWGTLFVGFALARGVTYILLYIRSPTSYLPSRPPSELIASFCLISGGLVFMLSTRDVISAMEKYDLNAMFTFTVAMGFTCFVMAWEIIVISLKAWATKREMVHIPTSMAAFRFPA